MRNDTAHNKSAPPADCFTLPTAVEGAFALAKVVCRRARIAGILLAASPRNSRVLDARGDVTH